MARKQSDIAGVPPVNISEHLWIYGGKKNLSVVQEERAPNGDFIRTTITEVPWSAIEKARSMKPALAKTNK